MFIKNSRLFAIIFASMFLGMGVAFYVQYVAAGLAIWLPLTTAAAMLLLIIFLLSLQLLDNRRARKRKEKKEEKPESANN